MKVAAGSFPLAPGFWVVKEALYVPSPMTVMVTAILWRLAT